MQRVIINKGKRYIANCPGWEGGIGAGFAVGQLVLKSASDKFWYLIYASGSAGSVTASISQSALPFPTSSYYDQNYPYQLLTFDATSSYAVFITGTAPNVVLTVSQSKYPGTDPGKPYLLLQSITNGHYYRAGLSGSAGTKVLKFDQTIVSQSWVHPIY